MWMFTSLENFGFWIGTLFEKGLGSIGEKLGDKVPPGRPGDLRETKRIVKGDLAELHTLYKRLLQYTDRAEEIFTDVSWGSVISVLDPSPDDLTTPLVLSANKLCQNILMYEKYFPLPEIDFTRQLSLKQTWELTALVRRCLAFYETKNHQEKIGKLLWMFLENILYDPERRPYLEENLIRLQSEEVLFAATLESLHPDITCAIEAVGFALGTGCSQPDGEPFPRLWKKYPVNLCVASGIDPAEMETTKKDAVMPSQMRGKSPSELVQLCLNDTPFPEFFTTNLPFVIPLQTRFSHMHIVGGSGHGKTQTLQNLLLSDLSHVGRGQRSVIVIDSQGDLIHNILKLKAVGDIADRVVLIYPRDIKYPPALNLFDIGLDRINQYNDADKEMLVNGAISLFEYMFGAILQAELTNRQRLIFRALARLLMSVPNATIETLRDFLQEPEKAAPYIDKLTGNAREFFRKQFFSKDYDDTRQQILTRVWGVLDNPTLERMFCNKRNKVDIYDAMNRGSLILIHTAKDLLKEDNKILGRFFIALIAQAAQERATMPLADRTPTFVYIDEAHDYFDEHIEDLLEQARKFQVGIILAHQHLAQFKDKLHAAVMTNTAIKLVGGLSEKDARALSGNMGCTPEFLLSMKKYESEKITQFACFVKNHTHSSIRLSIPLGLMEQQPEISQYALTTLIKRNRERYCNNAAPNDPPNEPDPPDSPLGDPDLL